MTGLSHGLLKKRVEDAVGSLAARKSTGRYKETSSLAHQIAIASLLALVVFTWITEWNCNQAVPGPDWWTAPCHLPPSHSWSLACFQLLPFFYTSHTLFLFPALHLAVSLSPSFAFPPSPSIINPAVRWRFYIGLPAVRIPPACSFSPRRGAWSCGIPLGLHLIQIKAFLPSLCN